MTPLDEGVCVCVLGGEGSGGPRTRIQSFPSLAPPCQGEAVHSTQMAQGKGGRDQGKQKDGVALPPADVCWLEARP